MSLTHSPDSMVATTARNISRIPIVAPGVCGDSGDFCQHVSILNKGELHNTCVTCVSYHIVQHSCTHVLTLYKSWITGGLCSNRSIAVKTHGSDFDREHSMVPVSCWRHCAFISSDLRSEIALCRKPACRYTLHVELKYSQNVEILHVYRFMLIMLSIAIQPSASSGCCLSHRSLISLCTWNLVKLMAVMYSQFDLSRIDLGKCLETRNWNGCQASWAYHILYGG